MRTDLSAKLLANQFQVNRLSLDVQHIWNVGRVQLDRKPGREIDAEVLVGEKQYAPARQHFHKRLPHSFGIGVSKLLIIDLPYLAVAAAKRIAGSGQLVSKAGNDSDRRHCVIDFSCRCDQLESGVVDDAILVQNVREDAIHTCSPPRFFINSISFSAISSRSPERMVAFLAASGTKQSKALDSGSVFADYTRVQIQVGCTEDRNLH